MSIPGKKQTAISLSRYYIVAAEEIASMSQFGSTTAEVLAHFCRDGIDRFIEKLAGEGVPIEKLEDYCKTVRRALLDHQSNNKTGGDGTSDD